MKKITVPLHDYVGDFAENKDEAKKIRVNIIIPHLRAGDEVIFAWVILPLLIFFSRICDVSIGTIRVIFVAKGFKLLAPLLGFFEVIIWLIAVRP
jgi:hypothetical protein